MPNVMLVSSFVRFLSKIAVICPTTSKVSGICQRLAVHDEGLRFTSRHRGRCAEKWQEHVRARNCSVQRRGSKSRSSLKRAEMIYYVTQSPRGS